MNGRPMDVLAVLGEMESFMAASYPSYDSAENLRAARAAVAELIKALDQAVTSMQDSGYQNSHPAVRSARAALARVGGAS